MEKIQTNLLDYFKENNNDLFESITQTELENMIKEQDN